MRGLGALAGKRMQANQPTQAPTRVGGARNVSTILSAVALVLAAGALAVSLAVPGPAGSRGLPGANGTNGTAGGTGPRGPQGPIGNGTLLASFSNVSASSIGTTCTDLTSNATLKVPSKGNVTVTASVGVAIYHINGGGDSIWVYASSSFGSCGGNVALYGISSTAPTDWYTINVHVAIVVPVTAAGTYWFTVGAWFDTPSIGTMAQWNGVSGYAVFYPG